MNSTTPSSGDILARGLDPWIAAGRSRDRFRNAVVHAGIAGQRAALQATLPTALAPA